MSNLDKYRELRQEEIRLREQVIQTQNPDIERECIRIALEREYLLFEVLTLDEIALLIEENKTKEHKTQCPPHL